MGTAKPQLVARPYDEVLHIEGLNAGGDNACATIVAARRDTQLALASRGFKARFFKEGLHAGGILQAPAGATPKAIAKMEKAIEEHRKNRQFETLVLEDGFRWFQTTMSLEQAQLAALDEATLRDLARRYLFPPSRFGLAGSVAYNSLEQDRRDHYDTAIGYWLSQLVSELNTKALTTEERRDWQIGPQLNLAMLYATGTELANIAATMVNTRDAGGRSLAEPDEARAWLRLPPRDHGKPQPGAETPPTDPAPAARASWKWLGSELRRIARRVSTAIIGLPMRRSRSGPPRQRPTGPTRPWPRGPRPRIASSPSSVRPRLSWSVPAIAAARVAKQDHPDQSAVTTHHEAVAVQRGAHPAAGAAVLAPHVADVPGVDGGLHRLGGPRASVVHGGPVSPAIGR